MKNSSKDSRCSLTVEPYAFTLLRRLRAGESVTELAAREGIPAHRIEMRLRAAELFEKTAETGNGMAAPASIWSALRAYSHNRRSVLGRVRVG